MGLVVMRGGGVTLMPGCGMFAHDRYLERELLRAGVKRKVTSSNLPVISPPVSGVCAGAVDVLPQLTERAVAVVRERVRCIQAPKQSNSVDCGVFVLMYAKEFLLTWAFPTDETPRHDFARRRWFTKRDVKKLRGEIQMRFTQWCNKPGMLLAASQPSEHTARPASEPAPGPRAAGVSEVQTLSDTSSDSDSSGSKAGKAMAPGTRAMPPATAAAPATPASGTTLVGKVAGQVVKNLASAGKSIATAGRFVMSLLGADEGAPQGTGKASPEPAVAASTPRESQDRNQHAFQLMETRRALSQDSDDDLASSQPVPPQVTTARRSVITVREANCLGVAQYGSSSSSDSDYEEASPDASAAAAGGNGAALRTEAQLKRLRSAGSDASGASSTTSDSEQGEPDDESVDVKNQRPSKRQRIGRQG